MDESIVEEIKDLKKAMAPPKKDVGIYALLVTILLFIFAQLGGGAYWAGSVKQAQSEQAQAILRLEGQNQYLQAQIQVLSTAVGRLEGQTKKEIQR